MGQYHSHGKSMGDIVQAGYGVAYGVNVTYAAPGEGAARKEGGLLHVLTRLYIRAVLIGIEQVVVN